ncbi:MAG: alpha/beta hydrolase [Anaerolinea sp.]|nr:alpha/beta hydrolase [Anaerolinea sp.]
MTQIFEERARRLPFAFTHLDDSVRRDVAYLEATDTAQSFGILYRPAKREPKTAVYLMHPRGEFTRHYVVPGLTARGYAVFGHNSRYLNNDTHMIHERLLFDVAAGMRYLKERGFERIILLGNSGGGSLLGFYQSQAGQPPAQRLNQTPAGDPIDLSTEVMPAGDLYIAVAAHLGEGRFILNVLDPAVIDEDDPVATDPAWDMYNPANGYRPFPQSSRYDAIWLAGYRLRQRERNHRLDERARAYLAEHREARERMRQDGFPALDWGVSGMIARKARLGRYMTIYRTLANPAYLDPTIDPSQRPLGSIFSPGDPIIGNYGPGGLARLMTPQAWLSTWSGLASQADLPDTIRHVAIPTLLVYADGDCDIFPSEQRELLETSGAQDKQLVDLPWADHYLHPVGEEGRKLPDPRERIIDLIVPWIEDRIGEP